ncbi:MAG: phage tail tape measure protein [Thermomicrobiales bacterium]
MPDVANINVKFTSSGADKVAGDLNKLGGAVAGADQKSQGFWKSAMSAAAGFLGAGLLTNLVDGVKSIGASALTSGLDFEQGMANVASVTGATGTELKQLSDLALKIGKDTSFGANDATLAIEELAKAGVSTGDILNGAADGAVALAAAGGVALPEAASVMSNALNQFGLSGDKAMHVADLMAGASAASATGVTELGESLKYVGTQAHSMGYGIEDITTALGLMANQGIVGSMAGTSLNNMLLSMANPTADARQKMNELGISFADANGAMKPLPQVLSEVAAATAGLTDEQRAATLETLFGVEGGRAMNALLASQTEEAKKAGKSWEDMYRAVTQNGVAAEQAAARMNSTRGSIEGLKGSLETLAIIGTMAILPMFRNLIDGTAGVVDGFTTFITTIQSLIAGGNDPFTAISLAMRGFLTDLFGLDFMNAAMPFVDGFLDLVQMVISGIQGAIGPIQSALGSIFGFIGDHFSTIAAGVAGVIAAFAGMASIAGVLAVVGAAVAALTSPILLVAAAAAALAMAYQTNFMGFADAVNAAAAIVGAAISAIVGYLTSAFSGGWMSGLNKIANDIAGLGKRFAPFKATLESLARSVQLLIPIFYSLGQALSKLMSGDYAGAFESLKRALQGLGEYVQQVMRTVGNLIRDTFNAINWGAVGSALMAGARMALAGLASLGATAWNWLVDSVSSVDWGKVASTIGEKIKSGLSAINGSGIWNWLSDSLAKAFDNISHAAMEGLQLAWDKISDIDWGRFIPDLSWSQFIQGVVNIATWLGSKIKDLPWSDIITGAWDAATKLGDLIKSGITNIPWSSLLSGTWDAATKLGDLIKTGMTNIPWSTILSGAWDAASKLGDLVKTGITSIPWSTILSGAWDAASSLGDLIKTGITSMPWGTILSGSWDVAASLGSLIKTGITNIPWSSILSGVWDVATNLGILIKTGITNIPWSSLLSGAWNVATQLGDLIKSGITNIPWSSILSGTWDVATGIAAKIGDLTSGIVAGIISKLGISEVKLEMPSKQEILDAILGLISLPFTGGGEGDGTNKTQTGSDMPGANTNDDTGGVEATPHKEPAGFASRTAIIRLTAVDNASGIIEAMKARLMAIPQEKLSQLKQIGGEAVSAVAAVAKGAVEKIPTQWTSVLKQAGGEAVTSVAGGVRTAVSAIPTSWLSRLTQSGGEVVRSVADNAAGAIRGILTSRHSVITQAGAGAVESAARAAAAAIAMIQNKTVYIDVIQRNIGALQNAVGKNASGGYVDTPITWLAEVGRELVRFPSGEWFMAQAKGLFSVPMGSYVYTNAETERMVGSLSPVQGYAGGGSVGGGSGFMPMPISGGGTVNHFHYMVINREDVEDIFNTVDSMKVLTNADALRAVTGGAG